MKTQIFTPILNNKLKSFICLVCALSIYNYRLKAQALTDLSLRSNDKSVTLSGNLGVGNVDLSTGVITPSIHLMDLTGKGNLKVGVDLIYQGGQGLQVYNIAGCTGWGWEISAGGSITVETRGIPDETIHSPSGSNYNRYGWLDVCEVPPPASLLRAGRLVDFFKQPVAPAGTPAQDANVWALTQSEYFFRTWSDHFADVIIDPEPDVFTFNFGGYSGSFVFNENGTPVTIPHQNIKIQPPFGPYATTYENVDGNPVASWIFTTPDGVKYIFENTQGFVDVTTYARVGSYHPFTSKFHLSRIVSPSAGKVEFNYSTEPNYGVHYYENLEPSLTGGTNLVCFDFNGCCAPTALIQPRIDVTKKELYSITSDNSSIVFTKSTQKREDMPFDQSTFYALEFITQYNKSDIVRKYQFLYSYFHPVLTTSYPPNVWNRLRLDAIKELSIGSSPLTERKYMFDYEPGNQLVWSAKMQDKWGFYNEGLSTPGSCRPTPPTYNELILQDANHSDGSLRLPHEDSMKSGILKQITYPSGGSINYEYELNQYYESASQSNENWGGLRIKKITEQAEPGASNSIIKEFKYTQENSTNSSGEVIPLRRQYDNVSFRFQNGNIQAEYYFRYSHPNRQGPRDFIRYTHVEVQMPGNGKESYDFTGYSSNPDEPIERKHFQRQFDYSLNAWVGDYTNDEDNDAGAPLSDFSFQRGLLTKVTKFKDASGGGYQKVQETNNTYVFDPPNYTTEEIHASRVNCNHKFSSNNITLSPGLYHVEYYKWYCKWQYLSSSSTTTYTVDATGNADPNNSVTETIHYFYDNHYHLLLTRMEKINSDGTSIMTKYKYPMDYQLGQLHDEEATAINWLFHHHVDNALIEKITYTSEGSGPPIVYKVTAAELYKYGIYGQKPIDLQSPKIYPQQIWKVETTIPINNFYESYLNSGGLFSYDSRYTLRSFLYYDKNGNQISSLKLYGPSSSTQFDPTTSFPVANFSNASYLPLEIGDECSFVGFEAGVPPSSGPFELEDFWNIVEPLTIISTSSHTGKYCQQVDNAISTTTLGLSAIKKFRPTNQAQQYKFSAWIKTPTGLGNQMGSLVAEISDLNNVQVQNVIQTFSGAENEWDYVEMIIDLPGIIANNSSALPPFNIKCYAANEDLSNNYLIDDIRFQPLLSNMISFTYKDPSHISSASNNNSFPTYFKYDGLGRLEFTLDRNSNVVNYSEYHDRDVADPSARDHIINAVLNKEHDIYEVTQHLVPPNDLIISHQYYDGLGRLIQVVGEKQSPAGYDVVGFKEYDQFGRTPLDYLPYVDPTTDGSFKSSALSSQANFYMQSGLVTTPDAYFPFAQVVYEPSPFNRVMKQGSVGSDWQPDQGHVKSFQYLSNGENEVLKWKVDYDIGTGDLNGGSADFYYPANTLYKYILQDANGHYAAEFKDVFGRIVMKQALVFSNVNLYPGYPVTFDYSNGQILTEPPEGQTMANSTYYVYDKFGRLTYTIPPGAINAMNNSNNYSFIDDYTSIGNIFFEYIYANHFDGRGRLIEKKTANAAWEYFVYDKLDRLIYSQNANQSTQNEWLFIKYDALDRIAITGMFHDGNSRQYLQNQNASQVIFAEKRSNFTGNLMGYTSLISPQAPDEIYSVNFYDNYDLSFDPILSSRTYQSFSSNVLSTRIAGSPTATMIAILDNPGTYLRTVNYYDEKLHPIQQHQQNQLNGWDVINNKYSFTNQLIHTDRQHTSNTLSLKIQNYYNYDHVGRKISTTQKVGNDPEIVLSHYNYNELGQVARKKIHYDPSDESSIQNIDFHYNIRGWLTNINNGELTNDGILNFDDNDAFGEDIFYNNVNDLASVLQTDFIPMALYNGNISAIKWKCKSPDVGSDFRPAHFYVYRYDDINRMTAAYFASKNSNSVSFDQLHMFDEKITYDISGNIRHLKRNAMPGEVDDLEYSYYNNANRLRSIEDGAALGINRDFHDGAHMSDEYLYNFAGNIVTDNNKDLTTTYNFLNLPAIVEDPNFNQIQYRYDATGRKLSRIADGLTRDYIYGIEYENGNLKLITTEEGRVRPATGNTGSGNNYIYEYFLKDHIGNIRVIITEDQVRDAYYATMEMPNSSIEEQAFLNIPTTREDTPPNYPPDNTYSPNEKVSELNAGAGKVIGHAKVLQVKQGDILDFDTKYFFSGDPFVSGNPPIVSNILTQLANIFILNPPNSIAGSTLEMQQYWAEQTFTNNPQVSNFLTSTIASTDSTSSSPKPRAYLIWLMFNNEFKFVSEASGVLQTTSPDQLADLAVMDLKCPDNGYMYIYVSNESEKTVNFDNLSILHSHTALIEENHYYPYGMLIEELSTTIHEAENTYKYQDKELQINLNYNIEEFAMRHYDPAIGRWTMHDPVTQLANPYIGMCNNPVVIIDRYGAAGGNGISGDGGNPIGRAQMAILGTYGYYSTFGTDYHGPLALGNSGPGKVDLYGVQSQQQISTLANHGGYILPNGQVIIGDGTSNLVIGHYENQSTLSPNDWSSNGYMINTNTTFVQEGLYTSGNYMTDWIFEQVRDFTETTGDGLLFVVSTALASVGNTIKGFYKRVVRMESFIGALDHTGIDVLSQEERFHAYGFSYSEGFKSEEIEFTESNNLSRQNAVRAFNGMATLQFGPLNQCIPFGTKVITGGTIKTSTHILLSEDD